jgi:hypothetical protein
MTRIALKLVAILTGLFVLPLVLLRAQPYDSQMLRAFLLPPADCAAPCFLGVRPGITTLVDAQVILAAHPWIDHIAATNVEHIYRAELAPAFPLWRSGASSPLLRIEDDVVTWVFWQANSVSRGDLRLALGAPSTIRVIHDSIEGSLPLLFMYSEYHLWVVSPLFTCALNQRSFWRGVSAWQGIYIGEVDTVNSFFGQSSIGATLPSTAMLPVTWIDDLPLARWVYDLRRMDRCA